MTLDLLLLLPAALMLFGAGYMAGMLRAACLVLGTDEETLKTRRLMTDDECL